MIGAILLIIAILLYFNPRKRYLSYFLYLSFMMNGMQLWTDDIIGMKNMDMAIIYTFVISAYLVLKGNWKIPKWPIKKYYIAVLLAICACVVFSYVHYGLTFFQILQGGRGYLLLFSLPILIQVKVFELRKVLKILLFFCVITSILYILQTLFRTPLMPYGDFQIDAATGLPRFYNSPSNLAFFLTLSFLLPKFFKGNIWIYRILFFTALIATLGRTFITATICTVFVALLLQGKMKKLGVTIAAIFILMTPFYGVISDRFNNEGGTSDFSDIANGNYRYYENGNDGGTMVYRFAWVYERFDYMTKRPIGELLFGLGLVSDSQPWVHQHYNFTLGLGDPETGLISQMHTPDISYGNLLSNLGVLGGIVYLIFVVSLTVFLFKNRKESVFIMISAALMITSSLTSFSSSSLSETKSFALIFMILSILYYKKGNISKGLNLK